LRAERALVEALRDGLSDDYFVYYSLHYLGDRAQERDEVDFLVFHRLRGMLVLECKGGRVVRRPDGRWLRQFEGRERPTHNPCEQAQKPMHTLKRGVEGRMRGVMPGRLPFLHGYAVSLVGGWAVTCSARGDAFG
jgi:hypothetical protein